MVKIAYISSRMHIRNNISEKISPNFHRVANIFHNNYRSCVLDNIPLNNNVSKKLQSTNFTDSYTNVFNIQLYLNSCIIIPIDLDHFKAQFHLILQFIPIWMLWNSNLMHSSACINFEDLDFYWRQNSKNLDGKSISWYWMIIVMMGW